MGGGAGSVEAEVGRGAEFVGGEAAEFGEAGGVQGGAVIEFVVGDESGAGAEVDGRGLPMRTLESKIAMVTLALRAMFRECTESGDETQ